MPRSSAPGSRTGRPPVTSRTRILTAARELIDRDGWERLTIRRLATELGIGSTTLYHHVRDKQDLLILLLNEHVGQAKRPQLPDDPRGRLVTATGFLHDLLAQWPWAAEVVTADGFVGLLDEKALWSVDAIVAAAIDSGCRPEYAVDVFRNLWYYTVGEILVRARTQHARSDDRHVTQRADFAKLGSPQLPGLSEVSGQWRSLAARDIYRDGLEAFIDGLLDRLADRS